MLDDGKKRGEWYWLSLSMPEFMIPAQMGMFGEDAQDQANTAAEDLGPGVAIVFGFFVIGGIVFLVLKALGAI